MRFITVEMSRFYRKVNGKIGRGNPIPGRYFATGRENSTNQAIGKTPKPCYICNSFPFGFYPYGYGTGA